LNKTIAVNAAPFSMATSTEHPDEAGTPDVSEAAMHRLRSPFQPGTGERPDPDGGREQHRAG
jgi:hypothetical protein